jgi:hypothetical protein
MMSRNGKATPPSSRQPVPANFIEQLELAHQLYDRGDREGSSKVMLVALRALRDNPATRLVAEDLIRDLVRISAKIQNHLGEA